MGRRKRAVAALTPTPPVLAVSRAQQLTNTFTMGFRLGIDVARAVLEFVPEGQLHLARRLVDHAEGEARKLEDS